MAAVSAEQLLAQQTDHLTKLKALLDDELRLISSRDPEALIVLLKSKESLLDTIQHIDEHLATLPKDVFQQPELAERRSAIEQLVEDCRYRTDINAKAVEQGQLRLEHLRTLILEARSKESMTYDKKGKPKGGGMGGGVKA